MRFGSAEVRVGWKAVVPWLRLEKEWRSDRALEPRCEVWRQRLADSLWYGRQCRAAYCRIACTIQRCAAAAHVPNHFGACSALLRALSANRRCVLEDLVPC